MGSTPFPYIEQHLARKYPQRGPAYEAERAKFDRWVELGLYGKAGKSKVANASEAPPEQTIEERIVALTVKEWERIKREDARLAEGRREHGDLNGPPQRTGVPGRPPRTTSKDLALQTFKERAKAGTHAGSLAAEASAIGAMIRDTGAAPIADGTIENLLRKNYDTTYRRPTRRAATTKTAKARGGKRSP